MQLSNVKEVKSFMDTISECEGDVYLKSQQGDVFNLKSSMSEYIAIGKLITEVGNELELFCQRKEDEARFLQFFNNNPKTL